MAHVYPVPLPCELCPYGKQCNVPDDKRKDCKLKTEESADFVDWKVNHPLFGMTKQELLNKQF